MIYQLPRPPALPRRHARSALALAASLAACAHPAPKPQAGTPPPPKPAGPPPALLNEHAPPYATLAWGRFTRQNAVAIALREWRLFGQPVDDDPPDTRPALPPDQWPERQPGLWQRVGDYWWAGQEPGQKESFWTGIHAEDGTQFDTSQDGYYAWSAAFISYVMRAAGAKSCFPYAANHYSYINDAAAGAAPCLRAYAPQSYAPVPGDLICTGRGRASHLRFSALPTQHAFTSHCDIVVASSHGSLTVIGGNVDDAVSEKHVPVAANGMLAGPDGVVLDTRYPWFVVLGVNYDAP